MMGDTTEMSAFESFYGGQFTFINSVDNVTEMCKSKLQTCEYPLAQLLPAPPPCFDVYIFSGLYRLAYGEDVIVSITWKEVTSMSHLVVSTEMLKLKVVLLFSNHKSS